MTSKEARSENMSVFEDFLAGCFKIYFLLFLRSSVAVMAKSAYRLPVYFLVALLSVAKQNPGLSEQQQR